MGNYCLRGIKFQFGRMKKILEMDGGDGCTTMYVLNTIELHT